MSNIFLNNQSNSSDHLPFTEAHAGLNPDVRVMRYKVIFYTMDHPLSEVRKWMKKGFNAWSNPKIDNYLRRWGCPTLEFVETTVRNCLS